jgi:hypothetical protein
MTEHELSQRLRAVRPPDEAAAQERTWAVIRAAHQSAARQPVARSRWRLPVPAVAGLAAITTLVLIFAVASAPRQAVARWVRDALGLTRLPPARPTLGPLPAGGQVLVTTPSGVWIVSPRGGRRRLGPGDGASFSPHSLYVAVWRGHELAALDLRGRRQWALSTGSPVSSVRWSSDGYRIAYTAGQSLVVLAGDGSGAHALSGRAAPLAPAWQPGTGVVHRVAFLDARGAVEFRDADTGSLVWSARLRARPEQLLWSADGRRLAVLARHWVTLYSSAGRRLAARGAPPGEILAGAALAPGDRLALLATRAAPRTSSLELVTATPAGLVRAPRVLLTAAERLVGISWSPDHRWLLAVGPAADQWLFVRAVSAPRIIAVSAVAAAFGSAARRGSAAALPRGFPRVAGWQAINPLASGS